jgi:3-isopropylmalate dehydrogenase
MVKISETNKKMNLLTLPGDGIGPEIVRQAIKIIKALSPDFTIDSAPIGGAGYDADGDPLPKTTLDKAVKADAILMGSVGDWKYDKLPREKRPERGLLRIRSELELFANLRPAMLFDDLVNASSLKPEIVSGLDILIVRELTGDIYFGEPRGIHSNDKGQREGFNTMRYSENEIRRIGEVAFQLARLRKRSLCSVDKANVLEATELWREVMIETSKDYPDVTLTHMYVDNAAMQLVRDPKQFDVMVTGNIFGDILSDEASMLTGSIGMLPSASLDKNNKGLFEPSHGSAPDIAGKDLANPIATIMSAAMMYKYSLNQSDKSDLIEKAIEKTLAQGYRTKDIISEHSIEVGCEEMGDIILGNLFND